MLRNILVLGLAVLATAMPLEVEIQERQTVTYTNGGCSTVTQLCYLPGGSPTWPCDSGAKCTKTNNVCTFSSANDPKNGNKYATGKAHCT